MGAFPRVNPQGTGSGRDDQQRCASCDAVGRGSGRALPHSVRPLGDWFAWLALALLALVLVRLARRYAAAPYRWQALKYVAAITLRNPSRLPDYIQALASGENLYALREVVLEDLRAGRLNSVNVRPLEERGTDDRFMLSSGVSSS